jgi:N-methylhydantoinase B
MRGKKVDPITLEVVRNRLDNIADEMEMTLLKSAFSSIIKEALDASAAIFDSQGRTLAQAASLPAQLGMLMEAVAQITRNYPEEEMFEGDVFILNDPYEGGTHLPDISVITPVFYKGKRVAFSASLGHHQDVGGKTPGSTPPDATELFAEGLIIPPLKLYEKGKANETLITMIKRNVRLTDVTMGDLRAQIACANVGGRRIVTLIDEYGVDTITAAMGELMDHSETLTRKCIEEMKDGTYSFYDYIDDDGIVLHEPVKIMVTVTIKGSNMHFDFSGSSPQARGPINSVPSSTKAMVYYIVRSVTDPTIPNNDGCYRPVTTHLPLGSIVNPRPPGACGCRTISIKRIVDVLIGSLVKAIPDKVHAASNGQLTACVMGGVDTETGKPYVFLSGVPTAGGMGARPNKDGIDVIDTDLSNLMNQPVEATEMDFPIRLYKTRLWCDSGGAGKYRGGLGYEAEYELLRGEATLSHRRDRHDFAPWGLFGGKAAPPCRTTLYGKGGRVEELPSKIVTGMEAGDRLHVFTTGGGGYGNPLERDPEMVLEDVLENRVSREAAYEVYGVVFDEEGKAVDFSGTEARRKELAEQMGPITWVFDRGKEYEQKTGEPSKHE